MSYTKTIYSGSHFTQNTFYEFEEMSGCLENSRYDVSLSIGFRESCPIQIFSNCNVTITGGWSIFDVG